MRPPILSPLEPHSSRVVVRPQPDKSTVEGHGEPHDDGHEDDHDECRHEEGEEEFEHAVRVLGKMI